MPAAAGENFQGLYLHLVKKLSLAATGEKILGVIFHMVKKLLLAAAGEFFWGYCSYGKKDHC